MESSASVGYGYDDDLFLEEVPDYFHCIFCHLILRDPLQIITCGHRFCDGCFQRYKTFIVKAGKQLVCPLDQRCVTEADIQPDVGTGRTIGNLRIACVNKAQECPWQGDLRDLKEHVEKCELTTSNKEQAGTVIKSSDDDLVERVEKIEERFAEKDKEIAMLKFNHQMLNENLMMRVTSFDSLERENEELKDDITRANSRMASLENEVQNLKELLLKKSPSPVPGTIKILETSGNSGNPLSDNFMPSSSTASNCDLMKNLSLEPNCLQPYLDIAIGNAQSERIVIDLFFNEAPQTCEYFIELCTNISGSGYKKSKFHFIDSNFCGAGELSTLTDIPCENLKRKHKKGTVTMWNIGLKGFTSSVFYILNSPQSWCDGQHVAFGQITTESASVVEKIAKVGGGKKPNEEIRIVDCGAL